MHSSKAPEAPGKRAAILIVHGIGEQQPYQTLDAFARGIASKAGSAKTHLSHLLFQRGEKKASAVRMSLNVPVGLAATEHLDMYELYWAGDAQGKIRLHQVLRWIAKTSLTPLRSWAVQPSVLFREKGADGRKAIVFVRELFRAWLLIAVAAAIVLPFVYAAGESRRLLEAGRGMVRTMSTAVPGGAAAVWLVVWLVVVFVLLMLVRGWWSLLRSRRAARSVAGTWQGTEAKALAWWTRASAIAIVILLAPAVLIPWLTGLSFVRLAGGIWSVVTTAPVGWVLGASLLAWLLRKPLVSYLGDVTLYVTADERSEFFQFRERVLEKSTDLLRWLVSDAGYESVYVAGHSLGSVIAYDTINRLICEARAETHSNKTQTLRNALDRLHGLLTFGSPLDKIYYFFRRDVGPGEAIRAQILSSLHGFRKRSSGREYGTLKFDEYDVPRLDNLLWYNVYSRADPVSGYLDFYGADKQLVCSYWHRPLSAHLAYWNDPGFYDIVLEWLTWVERGSVPIERVKNVSLASDRFRRGVERSTPLA